MINSLGLTTSYLKWRFLMHEHGAVEQSVEVPLDDDIRILSPDEAFAMFDAIAQRYMGMSGEEFLSRWDAGEYADDPDQPGVRRVYPYIAFVRPRD